MTGADDADQLELFDVTTGQRLGVFGTRAEAEAAQDSAPPGHDYELRAVEDPPASPAPSDVDVDLGSNGDH